MLLFRSEEHVDVWCAQRDLPRGYLPTLDQGFALAREWCGSCTGGIWLEKGVSFPPPPVPAPAPLAAGAAWFSSNRGGGGPKSSPPPPRPPPRPWPAPRSPPARKRTWLATISVVYCLAPSLLVHSRVCRRPSM